MATLDTCPVGRKVTVVATVPLGSCAARQSFAFSAAASSAERAPFASKGGGAGFEAGGLAFGTPADGPTPVGLDGGRAAGAAAATSGAGDAGTGTGGSGRGLMPRPTPSPPTNVSPAKNSATPVHALVGRVRFIVSRKLGEP